MEGEGGESEKDSLNINQIERERYPVNENFRSKGACSSSNGLLSVMAPIAILPFGTCLWNGILSKRFQ